MQERKYDREIDLKGLLGRMVDKWKVCLLSGVVFCLLMGALSCYKQKKDYDKAVAAGGNTAEEVKQRKEAEKNLIRMMDTLIAQKEDYYFSSLLYKIDPTNTWTARADLQIDIAGYEPEAQNAKEVKFGHNLIDYIEAGISLDELAAEMETEPRFLLDLIRITPDNSSGAVTVVVVSDNQTDADRILDYLLVQTEKEAERTKGEDGVFTVVRYPARTVNDATLTTWHYTKTKEISDAQTLRDKLLTTADESGGTVVSPSGFHLSKKKILKYGIVGFFGGILLGILMMILVMSTDNKALSTDEVCRYLGLAKLGRISGREPSRLAGKLSGEAYFKRPKEVSQEMTVQRLKGVLGDRKNIMLVGDVSAESAQAAADFLNGRLAEEGYHFQAAGKIDRSAEDVRAFAASDGAVLLSEIWKSDYRVSEELVSLAADLKKEIFGSITF